MTTTPSIVDRFQAATRRRLPAALMVVAVLAAAPGVSSAQGRSATAAIGAAGRDFQPNSVLPDYGPYSTRPAISVTIDLYQNVMAFGDRDGMAARAPRTLTAAMRLPVTVVGGIEMRYHGLSAQDQSAARHERTRVMGSEHDDRWNRQLVEHVRQAVGSPEGFPDQSRSAGALRVSRSEVESVDEGERAQAASTHRSAPSRPAQRPATESSTRDRDHDGGVIGDVERRGSRSADQMGNDTWYNIESRVRNRVHEVVGETTDRVLGRRRY